MIVATKAYQTDDGRTFSDLEFAKAHELEEIGLPAESVKSVLDHAEVVIAILKLKPRKSRVKLKKVKEPKTKAAA